MNGSSSNPSDYEFLLRTLVQGNHIAKAESLKRLNTLILSDKRQFASYAKRIVISLQDLMLEQKVFSSSLRKILICSLAPLLWKSSTSTQEISSFTSKVNYSNQWFSIQEMENPRSGKLLITAFLPLLGPSKISMISYRHT